MACPSKELASVHSREGLGARTCDRALRARPNKARPCDCLVGHTSDLLSGRIVNIAVDCNLELRA